MIIARLKTVIIILFVFITLISCKYNSAVTNPVISNLSQFSAEINFGSSEIFTASVFVYNDSGFNKTFTENTKTRTHRIKLFGLAPGKIYSYYIVQHENEKYWFRTKPQNSSFFRFIIYNNQIDREKMIKLMNHYPDFIINLDNENDNLQSFLPIFSLHDFMNNEIWAKSCLVFYKDDASLNKQYKSEKFQNYFIVSEKSIEIESSNNFVINFVFNSSVLKNENIVMIDDNIQTVNIGNDIYLVEVNGVDITLENLDGKSAEPVILRSAPLNIKKTCAYCKRLYEAKKYQSSIKWYKTFIEENKDHYQVDEALFMIGMIYDKNLHDYKNALFYYTKYSMDFKSSSKVPIVSARINYINNHNDYDYKPLKDFEQAKSLFNQKTKDKTIAAISAILEEYPDAKINDSVVFWLSGYYESVDYKKSISYLDLLISKYRETHYLDKAYINRGDILYQNSKYQKALKYYQNALENVDISFENDLKWKIKQTKRNIKREIVLYICIVFIITCLIFAFTRLKFSVKEIKISLFIFSLFIFSGLVSLVVFTQLRKDHLYFILAFFVSNGIIPFILISLKNRIKPDSFIQKVIFLSVFLLLFIAINYIIFHVSHLLYIFGV